jgi:hypothetical protein
MTTNDVTTMSTISALSQRSFDIEPGCFFIKNALALKVDLELNFCLPFGK